MVSKLLFNSLLCCAVSSCISFGDFSQRSESANQTLNPSGSLDFSWRLSGDRRVGPLQVFSDYQRTWIQWSVEQTIPAIYAVHEGNNLVLPYVHQTPYTVIEGHWQEIVFRSGKRSARATYAGTKLGSNSPQSNDIHTQGDSRSPLDSGELEARPHRLSPELLSQNSPNSLVTSQATKYLYSVTAADDHLRAVLGRWASISGWTFNPEHWAVEVDIPISGSATFSDEFKDSVLKLVATTELSERPLQPCFYSNQVVRIIAMTQACDRSANNGVQP